MHRTRIWRVPKPAHEVELRGKEVTCFIGISVFSETTCEFDLRSELADGRVLESCDIRRLM
jgi:hypothetical protein